MSESPTQPVLYEPFVDSAQWANAAVDQSWGDFLELLNTARQEATESSIQAAVDFAVRSAALETGAIEGLYGTARGVTQTVAIQGAMWEAKLDEIGPDVRGHFTAQLEAYELVLDMATQSVPVTESLIRQIHAVVCRNQETHRVLTPNGWADVLLEKGAYKTAPNSVTLDNGSVHWYASVEDVSPEMRRLVSELMSPAFTAAPPAVQAAYAHYALVSVHPFGDGNGRVARALASIYLYRAAGIPLVIFADQQVPYFAALAFADVGNYQPFVTFLEERSVDTMALIRGRLRTATESIGDEITAMDQALRSHGGLSHPEVEAIARRVAAEIHMTFVERQQAHLNDARFAVTVAPIRPDHIDCTFWDRPYRTLHGHGYFEITFSCSSPTINAPMMVIAGVARDTSNPYTFVAVTPNSPITGPLQLRLNSVEPAITAAASEMIGQFVDQVIVFGMRSLRHAVEQALRQAGY